jgi:serine O-acetyltransferase
VVIGENCRIAHGVTIGGRSGHYEVPVIGNNVTVGVGAVVLGPIKVGDHAIIGANAVVIHDVPAHAVVAGVPARIIKQTPAEFLCLDETWRPAPKKNRPSHVEFHYHP